ncbi:MAG: hypothetical protein HKN03_03905 [Acidimicrobiales bacterium]|nr:hypothetical protein [Acidimicrobiales bacterium]
MPTRHRLKFTETFYRPLAVKAEAVGPQKAHARAPVLLDARRETDVDESIQLIDESERLLTAADLYDAAVSGSSNSERSRVAVRPLGAAQSRGSVPLWGSGTSGLPRRGSRSVRLFHSQPAVLISHVLTARGNRGPLVIDRKSASIAAEDLVVPGELSDAFLVWPGRVNVSLRICRFNSIFSIAEIRLISRRHPRHFFQAAHRAIDQLCCG